MSNKAIAKNKKQSQNQQAQTLVHHQEQHFSGPIPHPDQLAQYNQIVPGAADRILVMAETDAAHRRDIEKGVLAAQIDSDNQKHNETRVGQNYAIIAVIMAFSTVAFALYLGLEKSAISIAGTTIVGLATVFIAGRKSQEK